MVRATETRNWFQGDPLLDWLNAHGASKGFVKDTERGGYDPRTSFSKFIMAKGLEFESRVIDLLRHRADIITVADEDRAEALQTTKRLVHEKAPVIYQGILVDEESGTYGKPDLIVRGDVLAGLCNVENPQVDSPDHHYIVDVKYTTAKLMKKSGRLGAGDRDRVAQLYVYNRALAQLQDYEPPEAFILGRSCKFGDDRFDSCFARLGPADMRDAEVIAELERAVQWIRDVHEQGADWSVLPDPTNDNLFPTMGNDQDDPWHAAKREIAEALAELTTLWRVTHSNRDKALVRGIRRWDDERCTAEVFGLAPSYTAKLGSIIASQRKDASPVMPDRITARRDEWHTPQPLEFYVDFETVSDVDDNFECLPERGGQPLIFMIGCGHEENGEWVFRCFTCDHLTEPCEAAIIEAWIEHMVETSQRFGVGSPRVFHWSPAETVSLTTAYNSARARHPGNNWPEPNWFDFLDEVVRAEPVTVKGSFSFGLKSFAKALRGHDLIETLWDDGPTDGLGAMVGAWWCDREASQTGGTLLDQQLMKSIESYNQVDCKVMWEAIRYLRKNH